jgi:hypothetical protein
MTDNATVSPPSTAARRYSEQVSLLVDRETRELLAGLAILDAERGGYGTPREAEGHRELLDAGKANLWRRDRTRYEAAVRRGRTALAARDAERAARAATPTTVTA